MVDERLVPGTPGWEQFSAHHLARYLFALEHVQGRCVLDAGTGNGYGSRILKEGGAASVVAMDIDPEVIEQARKQWGCDGIEFMVDDCEELGRVAGPFEVICNFENIEHLKHPDRFLAAAARALKPDGVLLVSTPDRAAMPAFVNGRPRNEFHLQEWYRDEFQAMLGRHFARVDMRCQVESFAARSRMEAVELLRDALTWANPITTFLWRKFSRTKQGDRSWKQLSKLANGNVTDCPILPAATAALFGKPHFHVAICRK